MNLKAIAFCFFLFVLTALLLSCGDCSKKIDCPGYKDDTLDNWFPYGSLRTIIFESNTGQRDTFTLRNTETTTPYQATSGAFSRAVCEARKTFQSLERDSVKRARMVVDLASVSTSRMIQFSFNGLLFSIYSMKANGLGQVNTPNRSLVPQILPTLTLGNHTYANAIEATGDTTANKAAGIYKLVYAPGEGLVSYSEYPSLITWTKQ